MKILQVDLQAVQVDLQQAHSLHSQTSQFFAGSAAFFNYASQKIMDELVARVFAAAEGGEQAVVDQVFQAGTGFPWVPITHSAPVIPRAWNLAPFLENALLVLGETGAAIADKPFLESIKMGAALLVRLASGRKHLAVQSVDVGRLHREPRRKAGLSTRFFMLSSSSDLNLYSPPLAATKIDNGPCAT